MRDAVIDCARRGEPAVRLVDTGALPAVLACVVGEGDPIVTLEAMLVELRQRTARTALRATLGRDEGYRVEDIAVCVLALPPSADAARLAAWVTRRLGHAVETIERP